MMHEPRAVLADELPALERLLDDVFRRSQGVEDQRVFEDFPLAFARQNLSNCRVIAEDGRLVSHAGIWPRQLVVDGRRLKLGVIMLVATHPDFRRRGHAARLMEHLQQTLRAEGYDLGILWTGVPEFYRRLGWQVAAPQGWLVDDLCGCPQVAELALPSSDRGCIVPYDPTRHLEGILALHDREPVRLARSRAQYAALLSVPKMHVRVLVRDGHVAAYLVAGQACNKRGLIEYGGPAAHIGALIADAAECRQLAAPLPLVVYHLYQDLACLVQPLAGPLRPLPCSKGPGCEMIYPLCPDRLPPELLRRLFIWGLDVT